MELKWIGPPEQNLESYPCRDHEEPDGERAAAALASGLFVAVEDQPWRELGEQEEMT